MDLREIHNVLKLSQNQLMQGQKSALTMQEIAMLYGIYKSKGGKGVVKGITPEQSIIESATRFYITESQKNTVGRDNKTPFIASLCERYKVTAQGLGVDVNYALKKNGNGIALKMQLTNNNKCIFRTGKEEVNPYTIELTISNSSGGLSGTNYNMAVEDMFMGLMGVKGCVFANTYTTVSMVGQLLKRVCA